MFPTSWSREYGRYGAYGCYATFVIAVVLIFCACGDKKVVPEHNTAAASSDSLPSANAGRDIETSPSLKVKLYADAKGALADVLLRTNPSVIGFGEFHQQNATVKIRSALDRFRNDLLPLMGAATSDLIIETWVPKGCGAVEKQVIREVEEVTERPKETENETVQLINSAKQLGVAPHILDVSCKQYQELFDTDGQMDFLSMLQLVGQMLGDTTQKAMAYRKENPQGNRQRILVYGGAIHNDLYPTETWESCAFGSRIQKLAKTYIAIDLYVPEFIDNSDLVKNEPWYPIFEEHASPQMAVLIEKAPDSYIIIFKRGIYSAERQNEKHVHERDYN